MDSIEVKYQVWTSSTQATDTLAKLAKEFSQIKLISCECHEDCCEDMLTLKVDDLIIHRGNYTEMMLDGDPMFGETNPKLRFAKLLNTSIMTLETWLNTITTLDEICEVDVMRIHGVARIINARVNSLIVCPEGIVKIGPNGGVSDMEVYGTLYIDDPNNVGDITLHQGGKVYMPMKYEGKIFSDRDLYYNNTQGYFAG